MNKKGNNIILILLLSALIGLCAGIAGELVARQYILNNLYNIPFFNEFEFSQGNLDQPNFIIKDAKKITIEQNVKIKETITSLEESLVGIFKKKNESIDKSKNFYELKNSLAQGFIITTDGWIISELDINNLGEKSIIDNYVVIDDEKNIYSIDKIKKSSYNSFVFLHLRGAKELPVREIVEEDSITEGALIIVKNWEGKNYLSYISEKKSNENTIKSSDYFFKEFVLTGQPQNYFEEAFVFDINGGIIGFLSTNDTIYSVNNFKTSFNNLLSETENNNPILGLNYIDLSEVVFKEKTRDKGALIYSDNNGVTIKNDSPAYRAGLEEGDIIIFINNKEVNKNNSLNTLIHKHKSSESILVKYLREGQEKTIEITLE